MEGSYVEFGTIMNVTKVFLSHTTRDQRDYGLAHKLADALQTHGVQVWIAPDSIPAGERWEEHIVSGVMEQCTHFLVILSAESTRAKWVLEEIRMAVERAESDSLFKIIPLPVSKALPDFDNKVALDRLQWVDYHENFSQQLRDVLRALDVRPQGQVQLPPSATDDFVGREYVFDAIQDFIDTHDRGYFVIEGDPGAGKTALLAEYVSRNNLIAHFNVQAQGINTASQFLESVCDQITARYGLAYNETPPDKIWDGAFFSQLINEVQPQLSTENPLIVAIDALDEVQTPDSDNGQNILFLPRDIPDHVYFVMTRREVDVSLAVTTPIQEYDLNDHHAETLNDSLLYIEAKSRSLPDFKQWLDTQSLSKSDVVAQLVERSGGNFMYLHYVIPAIAGGHYEIDKLPTGLQHYYEDHWRRMGMMAKPLPREKIRIVYILCELKQPASRVLIHQFADDDALAVNMLTVQMVLDEWDQFLHEHYHEDGTRYSIYHKSFRDFLHRKDIVQAAGTTLKEINQVIADELWGELFDND